MNGVKFDRKVGLWRQNAPRPYRDTRMSPNDLYGLLIDPIGFEA